MSRTDVQNLFKLRFDNAGKQIYMWPESVVQNTILAWNVSPTSASGYSSGIPTGQYFAPPNGPDCIEVAQVNGANGGQTNANAGYGECGTGSLVITGPTFKAHDIRISKRTTIVGRTNIEFAAELLNAFNHPNFTPISGITTGSFGTTLTPYQLTGLSGTDTRRTIQLVARVNW
jgi:hypothetical protein